MGASPADYKSAIHGEARKLASCRVQLGAPIHTPSFAAHNSLVA